MVDALFLALVVLQVLDILLTVKVLNLGGRELNKHLARLMARVGTLPALIMVKGALVALLAVLLWLASWASDPFVDAVASGVLVLSNVFYLWVVRHNYTEYRKMVAK